ncbi:MAG TPA: UDP-N-acetylmuramoyl-tripeptide--D-alanyl-D-alanine ligase, partial [Candidatus Eremiobacteraceae bacterium]|nr:UDP-N-acetylmuramoyl-tripeptide--D-alanyl-D-alanine ligase [Candidatus Eremiobacteraceae bacterium]
FARVTSARFEPPDSSNDRQFIEATFSPSTDSRTLAKGETFVCLRGPNHDGHGYADVAVRRGAMAVVADEGAALAGNIDVPVLRVADTKRAYMAGAGEARAMAKRCTVIGITGSVGKTTVKSMCMQLLRAQRATIETPENENNELGVSKACYALDDSTRAAVIEMGARAPGEIAELVDVAKPDVGVLTNVGEAHLEFYKSREELARTKFALFSRGAKAVLNAADDWSRRLAAESGMEKSAVWVRLCGDPKTRGIALEAGVPKDGTVPLTFGSSHALAPWRLIGEHHLRDALLAAGAAILAGISFDKVAELIGSLALPSGRFEQHVLANRAIVIYDAYNASPTSVASALSAFAEVPATRRIAVLGSMAELGTDAPVQHEVTGATAARSGIDALYCGGMFAERLAAGARGAGMPSDRVALFADNAGVAALLRQQIGDGDAVLLKGSRVQRMEEILAALLADGKAS